MISKMRPSPLTSLLFTLTGVSSFAINSPHSLTLTSRNTTTTCHSGVYIVVAPGTFENLEVWSTYGFQTGVINAIISKIPGSAAALVEYPENTNVSYGVPLGVQNAQKLLTDYYTDCPTSKTVLMGYSQGAIVTGSTLAGGPAYVPIFGSTGVGPAPLERSIGDNIIAIIQFGDLNRVEGVGIDADVSDTPCKTNSTYPRNGTALTNWSYYSDRIQDFCASSDGACCADQINIFAHLGYFTSANVEAASNFVLGKYNGTL